MIIVLTPLHINHCRGADMKQNKDVMPAADIIVEELAGKYRQGLVAMLTRLTTDPHRAEDLAQDALIIVIKKLQEGDIREPEKLSAYIYSTARFLYFGWLRKSDNKVELRESMEDFESPFSQQEDIIAAEECADVVNRSLSELPKTRDREILTRCYMNNQSKQEICEALLLSAEHYDRVIFRAKQRLRNIAAKYHIQPA
jgi:RNA polymerase sigma-70 factor (ECF subfamily)